MLSHTLRLTMPVQAVQQALIGRERTADEHQVSQELRLRTRLGQYVEDQYLDAKRHKENTVWRGGVSVHETLMRCLRMRNGEYDPELARALDGVDVYMPLASMKARAAGAWIRDTLANAEDKPWTVEPTPLPELSASGKLAARQAFWLDLQRQGVMLSMLPPGIAAERIKQLEDVAAEMEGDTAREACTRMEKLIHDQLEEGGWREAFDATIDDLTVFPAAIVKSPIVRRVSNPKWTGERIVMREVSQIRVERVSPFDLYPSRDSTDPQNGSGVSERMPMTGKAITDCKALPHFSPEAISALLTLYPTGYRGQTANEIERRQLEAQGGTALGGGDGLFDVIDYWGRVPGALLLEWVAYEGRDPDAAFPERVDPDQFYEVNVWHCAGLVLRCLFNPMPTGRRPYAVTSFNRLPGSFWGESVVMLLRDLQRQANSAARRLVQNMAYASGPIGEINLDALDESEDTPNVIRPYRVFYTRGSNKGKAINFDKVPSVAAELLAVFNAYWRLADEVCGIPAYSYGGATPSQGAASTMGGLSLLYNSALKGIKQAIGNLDKYLVEPVIEGLYLLNMLLYPDQNVKADATAVARGAKGIMAREMRQARTVETLQALQPFATGPMPIIPRIGVVNLLREWLKLQGFEPDLIFGKQLPEDLLQQLAAQGVTGPAGMPPGVDPMASMGGAVAAPVSTQPGTTMPGLDGRQAPVVNALRNDRL
jgi:hypothetical protein